MEAYFIATFMRTGIHKDLKADEYQVLPPPAGVPLWVENDHETPLET